MIYILHSEHSKESREFVAALPEGQIVISWYEDSTEKSNYLKAQLPLPTRFPFVVDTELQCCVDNATSLDDAKVKLQNCYDRNVVQAALNKRQNLLDGSDWLFALDSPAHADCVKEFAKYRQALRDLDMTKPKEIVWPKEPTYKKK